MLATAVCLIGIIFVFKELNKTKEEMNGFRTFSEQLVQHMNNPEIMEEDEDETNLEKIEEKKEE